MECFQRKRTEVVSSMLLNILHSKYAYYVCNNFFNGHLTKHNTLMLLLATTLGKRGEPKTFSLPKAEGRGWLSAEPSWQRPVAGRPISARIFDQHYCSFQVSLLKLNQWRECHQNQQTEVKLVFVLLSSRGGICIPSRRVYFLL